jgi:hypothetical protein
VSEGNPRRFVEHLDIWFFDTPWTVVAFGHYVLILQKSVGEMEDMVSNMLRKTPTT